MSPVTHNQSRADRCAILRGVLQDAARTVPHPRRTSPFLACLAEKILILAADGELDPLRLRRLAIDRVQTSCPSCRGCDGLQLDQRAATGEWRRFEPLRDAQARSEHSICAGRNWLKS